VNADHSEEMEPVARAAANMERLKDAYYRCRFRWLIGELAAVASDESSGISSWERLLLQANTHFELHEVGLALDIVKTAEAEKPAGFSEDYLYVKARLAYFLEDYAGAEKAFAEIIEATREPLHRFKALLGIANIRYSQAKAGEARTSIAQLDSMLGDARNDDRISLLILKGNVASAETRYAESKRHFEDAMRLAAAEGWTFFLTRCIYGLAGIAESEHRETELKCLVGVVRAMTDSSESIYFSFRVNERFKEANETLETPLTFDEDHCRIQVRGKWVTFQDRPLLFRFLHLLDKRSSFVGKEDIALYLWPEQRYNPAIHDPRIFDIAKRTRALVEAFESQPVLLLSGRAGYRLASAQPNG
jgi:tetratricopeptide (TPR) repeat protein